MKRGRCAGPAGGEISMAEQRERLVEARFPCLLLMRAAHTHTNTPGVDTHRYTAENVYTLKNWKLKGKPIY